MNLDSKKEKVLTLKNLKKKKLKGNTLKFH